MSKVFISYSGTDRPAVEHVAQALKSEGILVWFDQSLRAGERWDETIRAELDAATCVLVLWSKASWLSKWVHAEAQQAFEKGNLVAARLDEVKIGPPFNIIQTVDLAHARKGRLPRVLIEGIRQKLGTPVTEADPLQGSESLVRIVPTAQGIVLTKANDGSIVSDRETLSQNLLASIPRDSGVVKFVNLRTNSGEIVSCIVAGDQNEIYGDQRAFWWSFARATAAATEIRVRAERTLRGVDDFQLMDICVSAQSAWSEATNHHSIDQLREMPIFLRNVHYTALSTMMAKAPTPHAHLGYEIALCMILATQSEDRLLEEKTYQQFRQYLWPPGDEPVEFAEHDATI